MDSGDPPRSISTRSLPRTPLLVVSLGLAGAALIGTMLQPFRPAPLPPSNTRSWLDWWSYPIERNAFARLPSVINGERVVLAAARQPGTDALWAVGSNIVAKSTDSGRHWSEANYRSSDSAVVFREIRFFSRDRALVVGDEGFVATTLDGGASWQEHALVEGNSFPSPVWLSADRKLLRLALGETVFESADHGERWTQVGEAPWEGLITFSPSGNAGLAIDESDGQVATTSDGGRTWIELESYFAGPRPSSANDLTPFSGLFLDEQRALVGADDGVRETRDGGKTWTHVVRGGPIFGMATRADGLILAVDIEGAVHTSNDAGAKWATEWMRAELPVGIVPDGDALTLLAANGGLVVREGPSKWVTRSDGFVGHSSIVVSNSGQEAFLVGVFSMIRSRDGGRSWQAVPARFRLNKSWVTAGQSVALGHASIVRDELVIAVFDQETEALVPRPGSDVKLGQECLTEEPFVSGHDGWWPCQSGDYVTKDGGLSWTFEQVANRFGDYAAPYGSRSRGSQRITADRAWVLGGPMIWECQRGRACVIVATMPDNVGEIRTFAVSASRLAWALTNSGQLHSARLEPKSRWTPVIEPPPNHRLLDMRLSADGRSGWVVGDYLPESGGRGASNAFVTADGGQSWQARDIGTQAPLTTIRISGDGRIALAMSEQGEILRSATAGLSWSKVTHAWYPAPWAILVFVVGAALFVLAVRPPARASTSRIEDILAPDSPISTAARDKLRLNPLAMGIARFIANQNTEPPLTIAVSGEWGTGKTSLMNLLRGSLRRHGFRTVWFNAWHHQTDEHVLSSLIAALRAEALLPWWRPDGIGVRIRLLWQRGLQHWLGMCLLVFVFAWAMGHLVAGFFGAGDSPVFALLGRIAAQTSVEFKPEEMAALIPLAGAIAPLIGFARLMGGFGQRSLAKAVESSSLRDVRLGASVRQQFADVFSDVIEALMPRRLVIFIDDLDRCQPERVLAVLDLVSFLASSGRCFIVLGMAWDRVERSVGLGFKDLATDLAGNRRRRSSTAESSREDRLLFARQYLEKIINIEVPVPTARAEDVAAMFVEGPPSTEGRWSVARERLEAGFERWVAVLGLVALVSVGVWSGYDSRDNAGSTLSALAQPSIPQSVASPRDSSGSAPQLPPERPAFGAPTLENQGELRGGFRPAPLWGVVATLLIAAGAFGMYRVLVPAVQMESDSPLFQEALKEWCPKVYAKSETPRSVKRFVNRVRFFAMNQTSEQRHSGLIARLLRRLLGPRAPSDPVGPVRGMRAMPEDVLVELAARHQIDPEGWRERIAQEPSLQAWQAEFEVIARGVHVH